MLNKTSQFLLLRDVDGGDKISITSVFILSKAQLLKSLLRLDSIPLKLAIY